MLAALASLPQEPRRLSRLGWPWDHRTVAPLAPEDVEVDPLITRGRVVEESRQLVVEAWALHRHGRLEE